MKYALTVIATLAVLALLALVLPYTGLYNVSATEGHTAFARWYLNTTANHSIRARAGDIVVPAFVTDTAAVARGARAFRGMCQPCHGAPGRERGVVGQGMTPQPPRLSEAALRWEAGEVYWILDQGIKMAGMPAFGPTHSDEELWELVAFVKALPEMPPQRYEALTGAADPTSAPASDGHDHTH